jgi:hypothetical protein
MAKKINTNLNTSTAFAGHELLIGFFSLFHVYHPHLVQKIMKMLVMKGHWRLGVKTTTSGKKRMTILFHQRSNMIRLSQYCFFKLKGRSSAFQIRDGQDMKTFHYHRTQIIKMLKCDLVPIPCVIHTFILTHCILQK